MSKKEKHFKNNPFKSNDVEEEIKEENKEELTEENKENNEDKNNTLQAELDDLNNKYLRLLADFDNYRKRQDSEKEALVKYASADVVKSLIPVLDTLDKAIETVEKYDDPNTIKDSYNVAIKQLKDALSKIGLEKIEIKENEKFDPNFHEAISQTPTNDVEEGTILMEMRSGYKLKDKVLRPSMVSVTTGEG